MEQKEYLEAALFGSTLASTSRIKSDDCQENAGKHKGWYEVPAPVERSSDVKSCDLVEFLASWGAHLTLADSRQGTEYEAAVLKNQ